MVVSGGVDLLHGAVLDDLPGVHNAHVVAGANHHPQIVGDHYHGGAQPLLELLNEGERLGLDGHVQSSGGLVGDEDVRGAGQGDGDNHPLLHAAGELERVVVLALGGDAHHLQHLVHPPVNFLLAHFLSRVNFHGLPDLVAHSHNGVQGGHGVLEDHGDDLPTHELHVALRDGHNVIALEEDLPVGYAADPVRQQTHEGQGRAGLARAGLAHQTQAPAVGQGEADVVDGPDHAAVGVVLHRQVPDLHRRAGGLRGGGSFSAITHVMYLSLSVGGPARPAVRRPPD